MLRGIATSLLSKLKCPSAYAVYAAVVGVGSFGAMSWSWFVDLSSCGPARRGE